MLFWLVGFEERAVPVLVLNQCSQSKLTLKVCVSSQLVLQGCAFARRPVRRAGDRKHLLCCCFPGPHPPASAAPTSQLLQCPGRASELPGSLVLSAGVSLQGEHWGEVRGQVLVHVFCPVVQGRASHFSPISFTVVFPSNHTNILPGNSSGWAALEAKMCAVGRGMLSNLCKVPWSLVSCLFPGLSV